MLGAGRLKGKAQSLWTNEQFGAGGVDLLGARLEPEGHSLISVGEGLFPRACCSLISRRPHISSWEAMLAGFCSGLSDSVSCLGFTVTAIRVLGGFCIKYSFPKARRGA